MRIASEVHPDDILADRPSKFRLAAFSRHTKSWPGPDRRSTYIHELSATILHQLGIDHTKLTHSFQGCGFRLTDVHDSVVRKLI